jgi:hypothetical protein
MPNLLILTTRKLNTAPRVLREIQALAKDYTISAVGHTRPDSTTPVRFIHVSKIGQSFTERIVNIAARLMRVSPPVLESISTRLSDLRKLVDDTEADIIIAHEPHFLPFLKKLKSNHGFKLIYNAHEYHPLEFTDRWYWNAFWKPYYENIYRNCLPHVDLLINVCDSIAQKCEDEFGKKGIVIPNASIYYNIEPTHNEGIIRAIHHGGCIPSRKIEVMIEVAKMLGSNFHLDLMLTLNEGQYYDEIKKLADETSNVDIIEPVPFEQIVLFTNQYDIGLFLLPPTNYNYSVALPNKLFEFIQARLCVAIGPSPEMSNIVKKYNLGIISEDFTARSMAEAIGLLRREDIQQYKERSHQAAPKLSAENFNKLFVDSISGL